jgi:hypothetical protein
MGKVHLHHLLTSLAQGREVLRCQDGLEVENTEPPLSCSAERAFPGGTKRQKAEIGYIA